MKTRNLRVLFSKPFAAQAGRQAGMTIIEILIVIALIGTVMTIVVTNLTGQQENAMIDATKLAMGQLETNLQMYKVHNFRYPTTEQGLQALVTQPSGARRWRGPYTEDSKLSDPWGNQFDYQSNGRSFKIMSPGPSGVMGDGDDITYPEDAADDNAG